MIEIFSSSKTSSDTVLYVIDHEILLLLVLLKSFSFNLCFRTLYFYLQKTKGLSLSLSQNLYLGNIYFNFCKNLTHLYENYILV